MPRKKRVLEANRVYHVYNRRTDRQLLFPSASAYDEFLDLLEDGRRRYCIRICAYCPLATHWHQAIWVRDGGGACDVSNYLRRLSSSHAIRFRLASGTRGNGHVYQDRFKSPVVESERHYLTLVRYIEANPLEAGLVRRAEEWRWSSLAERLIGGRRILEDGPVLLPSDWVEIVNARVPSEDAAGMGRTSAMGDGGQGAAGRRSRRRSRRL
jgi:putative transposase